MKKTLHFTTLIQAPRRAVAKAMLERPTYEQWTAAFCEGSTWEGSWDTGARIRFLGPGGQEGMLSEIADHRPAESVSIRHIGIVQGGVDDTTSEKARAWAPAYENYTFVDEAGGTRVNVDLDTVAEYETFMNDTYPKALERLKAICETATS